MSKYIILIFLVLNNISYAGKIYGDVKGGKGGNSTFGKAGKGGNVYNDKVTFNSSTKSKSKTNSTTNNKNTNFNANVKTNINGLQKFLTDIIY